MLGGSMSQDAWDVLEAILEEYARSKDEQ